MADRIDTDEVRRLLDSIERDLAGLTGEGPKVAALRDELQRLRELLQSSAHEPHDVRAPIKLYRSDADRKLAGVCGGLGDFFRIDPVLFRVAFVILAFACGVGILLYLALWLLLPRAAAEPAPPAGDFTV